MRLLRIARVFLAVIALGSGLGELLSPSSSKIEPMTLADDRGTMMEPQDNMSVPLTGPGVVWGHGPPDGHMSGYNVCIGEAACNLISPSK
jgi:hypothetical protein